MPYKHTQIGYSTIVLLLVLACIALVLKIELLLLILVVLGILFSTLTISVEGERIRLWFGPGFVCRELMLGDIEVLEVAKHRCWVGGIHGWPGKGWSFHMSGSRSLKLKMRTGERYSIGTDQPEMLEKAIHEAMSSALHRAIKTE